jgi:DNA replication licensing factor MCM7
MIAASNTEQIPPELKRRYELAIVFRDMEKAGDLPLRKVDATCIGKLVNVKGIVTRVTEVKPYLNVACYLCDVCGFELFQTIGGTTFMPIVECPSSVCA